MGVHGLWDLLAPVGRRVSVETIAGKRLAIDASIWIVQFMKAMRDERGEMVRNAHLLGFFRRICKLLFLRTKPVFVFDGGTPALKRRTVVARRRQRENAQAKIRKTAEKLLLNQLKTMRMKELAKELKRPGGKKERRGEKAVLDETNFAAEEDAGLNFASEEAAGLNFSAEKDAGSESFNQEALDEMLAASLAAEERGEHHNEGFASTSASGVVNEEEEEDDDDNDDKILLSLIDGDIDPTVLATLPPSMQLDLLGQMREKLMAENRQKYQKVKKAPQKFSELQIQSYLKTVAFRREIDEVQKAAAGKGVGGVQTARIASEADKEFIFSSSFTGDKHVLASAAVKKQNEAAAQGFSSDVASMLASAKKSRVASMSSQGETATGFGNDVHTYLDERGHTRVSRLRAMGFRMTRDLERNLDLMKESEQVNIPANSVAGTSSDVSGGKLVSDNIFELNGGKFFSDSKNHDKCVSGVNNGITLEISFEDNEQHKLVDSSDDLFAHLVTGSPVLLSSADDALQKAQDLGLDSDCEWEEGKFEELVGDTRRVSDIKLYQVEASNDNKEAELEGQDRISNVCAEVAAACPPENLRHKSRGFLEEEAALNEAMRRSLEDLEVGYRTDSSNDVKKADKFVHMAPPNPVSLNNEISQSRSHNGLVDVGSSSSNVRQNKFSDGIPETKDAHTSDLRSMLFANVTDGTTEVNNTGLCGSSSVSIDAGDRPSDCYAPRMSSQTEICTGSALSDSAQLTLKHKGQNESEASLMCDSSKAPAITNQEEYMKEPSLHKDVNVNVADVELFDHQERASNIGLHGSAFDESGSTEAPGTGLDDELQFLSEEFINLENEQRKLERNADSVNTEMFVECQELLQMFGIPYIIAPMEAEAQCGYMEIAGLVDGVVTDDSDVFLFGARSVYKNIFDDRKYVETYFMKDIESELGLTREKLIRMAMLLGSDYTEGVSGIGIVNAIEVMTAFPEEDGLSKFREWVESPDPTILDNLDIHSGSSSKKKDSMNVSKSSTKTLSADGDDVKIINDKQELDDIPEIRKIFMNKHRNVSKNWHIPSTFPSSSVVSAYISPQIDKSTEPFSWGKPDLFLLRRLSWEKFGWANEKVNELLLPVLKEYSKQETQMRLEAFYSFNEKFAKIRSKRIKKAVKGMRGNPPVEVMDDTEVIDHRSDINKAKVTEEGASTDVNKTSKGPRKRRAEKIPSETTKMKRQREKPGTCSSARISGRKQESSSAAGSRKRGATHVSQIHNTATSSAEDATQDENPHQDESFERSMCPEEDAIFAESYNEADETINLLSDDKQKSINNEIKQQESLGGKSFVRDDNYVGSSTIVNQTSEESLLNAGEADFSYLETGGGFCSDDNDFVAEEGKETKGSDRYLETGGGFCSDDDDDVAAEERREIDDPDEASLSHPSPPAPVSSCIDSDTKFERGRGLGKRPRCEESGGHSVDSSVQAFSAMPYLRRKKKSGS